MGSKSEFFLFGGERHFCIFLWVFIFTRCFHRFSFAPKVDEGAFSLSQQPAGGEELRQQGLGDWPGRELWGLVGPHLLATEEMRKCAKTVNIFFFFF